MKAIVMDIDNTICEKKGTKNYIDLEPYSEVVEMMRQYKSKGYQIILQTARQMNTHKKNIGKINIDTLPTIIEWLNKWDIPYDELYVGKPWCGKTGFYVDDRAIRPSEFLNLTENEILEKIEGEPWK
ncbi:capsular biosynthesis protein [Floricoccus tropicus]|uniref:Capsular biosynthesis protein n=1 Tax=Floricoccus tropicus TaxID=1859473 RepID=A0A1E8GP34_9LACT|nr:capsular biosynthesis protein [Floricoccus tropicus]OFI49268.1 capsular biosynthesis protein [Floricoccus tropicus]